MVCAQSLSRVWLFVTPWTVACQAPLSMEFSRQEYWSGVAVSFSRGSSRPRDQTHVSYFAGRFFTTEMLGKPPNNSSWRYQFRFVQHYLCVKWQPLSCVWLFETPWPAAHQALLSMEFSRQEYWSGLPLPSPGVLSDPGIGPGSPALQADPLPLSHTVSSPLLNNLHALSHLILTTRHELGTIFISILQLKPQLGELESSAQDWRPKATEGT